MRKKVLPRSTLFLYGIFLFFPLKHLFIGNNARQYSTLLAVQAGNVIVLIVL